MNNLFGWSDTTWLSLDQVGILFGDFMLTVTIAGAAVGYDQKLNRSDIRSAKLQCISMPD